MYEYGSTESNLCGYRVRMHCAADGTDQSEVTLEIVAHRKVTTQVKKLANE